MPRRPARPTRAPRASRASRAPRDPGEGQDLPQCQHFGHCGGCSLLDQPVDWQLHGKVAASERLLAPFLGSRRLVYELPERPPQHFRTRLLYPVRAGRDGQPAVGIYAFRSHELVRIRECRTQDLWLTALGSAAEQVLRQLRLAPFEPRTGEGHVKAFWARLASGTGEVLAGLVTRPGPFAAGREFAAALATAAERLPPRPARRTLVGVVHSLSDRDDAFLLGDRHVPLRGRDHVLDRRAGLQFRISAGSFYQIHADAHALLYDRALAMCGPVRGQRVIDGYGGIGAFGLRLAKAGAAAVLVVEDNLAACRDAEHNARANDLPQVTVQRAAFAAAQLPVGADLMVVDPPRSGLQAAGVAAVLAAAPRRVLHVACDPQSLAQDLQGLVAGGYRLVEARLVDLFPHTEHQELVALLERPAGAVTPPSPS